MKPVAALLAGLFVADEAAVQLPFIRYSRKK